MRIHARSTFSDKLPCEPLANNRQAVQHCLQVSTRAAPSYLAEMCVPVAASTGRRCLRSAAHGDLRVLQSPDHMSGKICH